MQTLSGKIITITLSLFLLLYVGYQGYRHFSAALQTQTVFQYTVQDTEKVQGLVVRDETVMGQSAAGVVSYFSDDGVKVAVGTPVAEVYPTKDDVLGKRRIRELESQLEQLTAIEAVGSNYFLNSDAISKQLSESLYAVIKSNESGALADIPEQKAELLANLNRKQLATGVVANFSTKAAKLEAEKQQIEAALSGSSESIAADRVGYFSSYVDGLEVALTAGNIESLSAKDIQKLMNGAYMQDDTKIGKIIDQEPWRFVLLKELEDAEMLYKGLRVNIDFGIPAYQAVPARVESTREDLAAGKQIAVLRCDYMCPELTRLRNPTVELHYQVYSGLKIPSQAVRFKDGVKGVYVSVGDIVTFKNIDVVYEGRGYVLCQEDKIDEKSVKLYDEVVVSGIIPEESMASVQPASQEKGADSDGGTSSEE